ncbi:MAG: hypothetical protein MJE77_07925 [Proteobacteria bacterium]|nr:hypothetical protein [Pseudomonadota bacterium]
MYNLPASRTASGPAVLATVAVVMAIAVLSCAGPTIEVAQPAEVKRAEGVEASDFVVTDYRGRTIALGEESRDAVVVLVFYRGHW